uniref:Protein sprouty n=1 Tax=Anopheles minimus TaxID=112268 RepID=A0A182WCS5_9DIPT
MDRRNGGTSLAPPRPPKSLPRVHRPRAPDPNSSTTPATNPTAMIGMMVVGSSGATGNGGSGHPVATTAATPTPPQLSPKPRHLIGGSSSSSSSSSSNSVVLGSSNLSNGNDNSSNLASNNISSNSNNNISNNNNINSNSSVNNNNTIFMHNNPHNHTSAAAASSGESNFNSASLISSNGSSSRSTSSSTSSTSNSTSSSSTSSRSNHSNLNNNSSTGGSSQHHHPHHQPHPPHPPQPHPHPPQHHQHHHHHHHHLHQHNHPHQQSNRSIGSNSSTLSSVSSSSSTRPTSPVGSTFARRRHSPTALHHPHLTSIPPLGSVTDASAAGTPPPVLLLPVDQPIVPTNNSASNPTTPVTLAAPRPENERLANEYVDTPFGRSHNGATIGGSAGGSPHIPTAGGLLPALQQGLQTQQQHRNLSQHGASDAIVPVITGQPRPTVDRARSPTAITQSDTVRVIKSTEGRHGITAATGNFGQNATGMARGSSIITKQPTKKKDGSDRHELLELELQHHHHHHHRHHGRSAVATVGGAGSGPLGAAGVAGTDGLMGIGSITCPRCRRCRCEECQKPRPLPSHWLCDKSCLCSAETIIDYASCLCCVKALYYHCSKEHEFEREVIGPDGTIETETVSCADDPCSCVPHKRTTRWGCLGALSVALPCLWCYWPMRGCVAICARCYAKHSRHGCRCTQHPAAPAGSNTAGGILNGSMFGTELMGGPGIGGGGGGGGGGLNTASLHGHELRAKGDPADGDSTLQHLHHHLRHHLHRSVDASSTDLTTPEKRLLDTSTDTSY